MKLVHTHIKQLIITCIAIMGSMTGWATHIVGGEIMYTYVGNNNYQITLKVYRDCGPTNINGTDFDAFASVGIFNGNGNLVQEVLIELMETNVEFIPVVLENPCFVLPPDVCVESATYSDIVNLPPAVGGYDLVYQRCCRNPSIINLINPEDAGATFTTHVPGVNETTGNNTSAQFVNFPPPALCANAEFFFDHFAEDPDGDSLVYELCQPLNGADPFDPAPQPPMGPPFQTVTYDAGFSAGYPITSNPAFSIDPQTGYLTGNPTQLGQYVIGICVSEYRNGVLINTTNRDFQFNVTVCDPNIVASVPDQTSFCDGLTIAFENNSINAASYLWDFGVPFETSDTTSEENPTFTFPGPGSYEIMLIANPGWFCADTAITTYETFPVIEPEILPFTFECVNDQGTYDFFLQANAGNLATYQWSFGSGSTPATSSVANPQNIILNPEAANYTVSVTVTDNGCVESDEVTIVNPPEPEAAIIPQESFCDGLNYTFQQQDINATEYYWDFNTPINGDNSLLASPEFTFPDTGVYNIMHVAKAPQTCPDTVYLSFAIYGLLDPSFPAQASQCLSTNSFDFIGNGASTDDGTYQWNFGPNASPAISTQANPQNVSFNAADTYTVSLTISENGCVETYTDDLWVAIDPTLDIELNNTQGCPDLYVSFYGNSEAETQVFYSWDLGNGVTSFAQNPVGVYTQPGVYDVSVQAMTVSGCVATLSETLINAVTVHPVPIADFTIDPMTVNILEPLTTITSNAINAVECLYLMSDGGESTDCDFAYEWTEAGQQTITQVVTNSFGCTAVDVGVVVIEGFLFYAPNSFSPNNDGINDVWIPEMTGITEFELNIYNRWGEVIFSSTDPTQAWTGQVRDGDYFAQDGTYVYHIRCKDLLYFPYEYTGHINLVR